MAKEATAIRFAPEEKDWIQSYADFVGKSFSEVVRESVLERIEDAADVQAYEAALAEDSGVTYSMDEAMSIAMMAD